MWALIAKWAVKIALYAVGHPDKVKTVIDDVVAAKAALDAVKK